MYKQYYADLIRRGTEGLRHLNEGRLPSANAPVHGEPHQAPVPPTAEAADAQARDDAAQVCSLPGLRLHAFCDALEILGGHECGSLRKAACSTMHMMQPRW